MKAMLALRVSAALDVRIVPHLGLLPFQQGRRSSMNLEEKLIEACC